MIYPEQVAKAFSDQTRLRILLLLNNKGELCVCDLISTLDLEQPKISRHLSLLRQAALVTQRKQGNWVYYRLHPTLKPWVVGLISSYVTACSGQMPYCDDIKFTASASASASCC
jgi:ArsR family transcriptional regulator